ncbi:MAG: methylmalonyl-CoA mutase [Syntrophobacterales bacterium CG_4_8_14_3_um_filter_58_8]|nr:MAG: methylmalonyl-CoA mutase [Syntrophobacterales bacterium CG_4_8_14_3_um_filter_58_8]
MSCRTPYPVRDKLDPASSPVLDSRFRGNDGSEIYCCRSNNDRAARRPSGEGVGRGGGQRSVAKKIKVLLAKLGLDVHNRGIITVAKELGDAGMEIVYIGNSLPREIVQTAIQENVDVIGVSSLGGAHLTLGKPLIDVARQEELTDSVAFVIGGVFPPDDAVRLKEIGFDAVFTPGATRDEIVHAIQGLVEKKTH